MINIAVTCTVFVCFVCLFCLFVCLFVCFVCLFFCLCVCIESAECDCKQCIGAGYD